MTPTPMTVRLRRQPPARSAVVRALLLVLITVIAAVGAIGPTPGAASAAAAPRLPSPTTWPLAPTPEVLRGFEPPDQPWGSGNRGLDLAADPDQQVLAVADGIVTFAGQVGGHGVVVVTHGAVRTTYTPVAPRVSAGDRVGLGTVLGVVEGRHCVDRVCLHLGLLAGDTYLDPMSLFGAAVDIADRGPVRLLPAGADEMALRRATLRRAAGAEPGVSGAHGFVLPAAGPISSGYGPRVHPVTGVHALHDGTDIAAPCGDPVVSPAAGTVAVVDVHPALGLRVVIDHGTVGGHQVRTAVNHLSAQRVRVGQRLPGGGLVGLVGSTGLSTGCHVHLMLWLDGRLADPMGWF